MHSSFAYTYCNKLRKKTGYIVLSVLSLLHETRKNFIPTNCITQTQFLLSRYFSRADEEWNKPSESEKSKSSWSWLSKFFKKSPVEVFRINVHIEVGIGETEIFLLCKDERSVAMARHRTSDRVCSLQSCKDFRRLLDVSS